MKQKQQAPKLLTAETIKQQFKRHYGITAQFMEVIEVTETTVTIRYKPAMAKTNRIGKFCINEGFKAVVFPPITGYTNFIKIIVDFPAIKCRLFVKERETLSTLKLIEEIKGYQPAKLRREMDDRNSLSIIMRRVCIAANSYRYHKRTFDRIQGEGIEKLNQLLNQYKRQAA